MHAETLSSAQKRKIRKLTGGVRRNIDSAVRQQRASLKVQERERLRDVARREREELKWQLALNKRLDSAVEGCRTLIDFAQSSEIQEYIRILADQHKLANYRGWMRPAFPLYCATRPSGDAWDLGERHGSGTRDVRIELWDDRINIVFGCRAIDPEEMGIPYASTDVELRELLKTCACVGSADIMLALDKKQREYEWGPETIVFQVFVDCATQSRFKKLLKAAFACPALAPAEKKKKPRTE
jgi:hypothetical protein